jgi:hypothetical protein
MRSRDAFVPLMALCSFVMSFFHGVVLPPNVELLWVRALWRTTNLHPEWLQMFQNSPILDFSGRYPRIGTVVDVSTWRYLHLIRATANAGVPVWFWWGPLSPPMKCSPDPVLDVYFPTRDQVDAALRAYKLPRVQTGFQEHHSTDIVAASSFDRIATASPVNRRTFPTPRPNSRQKYGKMWLEFFRQREKRHKEKNVTKTYLTGRVPRNGRPTRIARNMLRVSLAQGRKGPRFIAGKTWTVSSLGHE